MENRAFSIIFLKKHTKRKVLMDIILVTYDSYVVVVLLCQVQST